MEATADDPNRRDNRVSSPALLHPVTISRAGAGRGSVRSAPPGIDCGGTCSAAIGSSGLETGCRFGLAIAAPICQRKRLDRFLRDPA